MEDGKTSDSLKSWVVDIISKPKNGWTIYKVPQNMRDFYKDGYTPTLVSIGPFHYQGKGLESMEDRKIYYLQKTLQRKFYGKEEEGLHHLYNNIKKFEKKVRNCYSEKFPKTKSDDFVCMMVKDGCFIIHLLRSYGTSTKENQSTGGPIFIKMLQSLQEDLIKLENQIPYCVLKELYELTKVEGESEPSLPELIVTFFNPLLLRKDVKKRLDKNREDYNHMLDVFRSTFVPYKDDGVRARKCRAMVNGKRRNLIPCEAIRTRIVQKLKNFIPFEFKNFKKTDENILEAQNRYYIPSATELSKSPITIRNAEGASLLDISFNSDDGSLSFPPLHINDSTLSLIFNFIAYEQCHEKINTFFTDYYMFLDGLINSTKDIKILRQNGIFDHDLTSDVKATNLINKFGKTIISGLDNNYLLPQMREIDDYLKAYHESKWRQFKSKCRIWWEQLMEKYFSSPWAFVSLLAATALLILTVIQTIYAVYKP